MLLTIVAVLQFLDELSLVLCTLLHSLSQPRNPLLYRADPVIHGDLGEGRVHQILSHPLNVMLHFLQSPIQLRLHAVTFEGRLGLRVNINKQNVLVRLKLVLDRLTQPEVVRRDFAELGTENVRFCLPLHALKRGRHESDHHVENDKQRENGPGEENDPEQDNVPAILLEIRRDVEVTQRQLVRVNEAIGETRVARVLGLL